MEKNARHITARVPHHRVSSAGTSSLRVWLVWAAATLSFVVVRLIRVHGVTGFPVAQAKYVSRSTGLRIYSDGYDGQFVYRLALDPFTRTLSAHGITFDVPAYRQQRIGTALLARALTFIPGISTAAAIVAVNTAAVLVAGALAIRVVRQADRSAWWALVLAAPACLPISLGRDLTEPMAWAAVLGAIVLARSQRWLWASLALTLAVLTRETTLLVILGLGAHGLYLIARRRAGGWSRLWLALPLGVEVSWQLYLRHVWGGSIPFLLGKDNTSGLPLTGVFRSLWQGLPAHSGVDIVIGVSYLAERIVLITLLVTAGWSIVTRRSRASGGEQVVWGAAALLALSLQDWGRDVQFLRAAYEAWAFSLLVIVGVRTRLATVALVASGLTACGVAVLYALRV